MKAIWLMGIEIMPTEEYQRGSFFSALGQGLGFPPRYAAFIFHELFVVKVKAEFTGPVGIVKVVHQQVDWRNRLTMLAICGVWLMLLSLLIAPLIFWRAG